MAINRTALITSLLDSLGAKNSNPEIVNLYIDGLEDLTDDELRYAITQAIKTIKWMPKVVELRELAADYRSNLETGWVGDVREMRKHCMWYYASNFYDPRIHESKEYKWLERQGMVGWAAIHDEPKAELTPEDQFECDLLFSWMTGESLAAVEEWQA